jgi:hypothetical protein
MSNDSRSLAAVLVVCAMVGLACVVVPAGVGAIMYVRFQRIAEEAVAERDALAAEQARMAAEMARLDADMQAQRQKVLENSRPVPPVVPAPPARNELTLDERKTIYLQLKLVRDQLAALEALSTDDPTLQELTAQGRAQVEASLNQVATAAGLTRKQLDEIMAEGEREKW